MTPILPGSNRLRAQARPGHNGADSRALPPGGVPFPLHTRHQRKAGKHAKETR
jgi:hypothetical protein